MATAMDGRRPAAFLEGRRRRLASAVLAAVLVSATAGCAGPPTVDPHDDAATLSSAPTSTSSSTSQPRPTATHGGGHAHGAPTRNHGSNGGGGGGGGAAGAPIRIPARFNDEGRPLAEVSAEIEQGFIDECGGRLCVTLRTVQVDDGQNTACTFVRTDPPQRSMVKRGSTVTIVSGALPCVETSSPDTPETSPADSPAASSPGADSSPPESPPESGQSP